MLLFYISALTITIIELDETSIFYYCKTVNAKISLNFALLAYYKSWRVLVRLHLIIIDTL